MGKARVLTLLCSFLGFPVVDGFPVDKRLWLPGVFVLLASLLVVFPANVVFGLALANNCTDFIFFVCVEIPVRMRASCGECKLIIYRDSSNDAVIYVIGHIMCNRKVSIANGGDIPFARFLDSVDTAARFRFAIMRAVLALRPDN